MSKKTIVTILSSIIIIVPFLGLPASVSTVVFILSALGIIYIARSGSKKKV